MDLAQQIEDRMENEYKTALEDLVKSIGDVRDSNFNRWFKMMRGCDRHVHHRFANAYSNAYRLLFPSSVMTDNHHCLCNQCKSIRARFGRINVNHELEK